MIAQIWYEFRHFNLIIEGSHSQKSPRYVGLSFFVIHLMHQSNNLVNMCQIIASDRECSSEVEIRFQKISKIVALIPGQSLTPNLIKGEGKVRSFCFFGNIKALNKILKGEIRNVEDFGVHCTFCLDQLGNHCLVHPH